MKIGTKSLLYGVHAFWWHPVTVWLAWIKLYKKFPNWKECVCIFIHDWGYYGMKNMDGGPTKLDNGYYDYEEGFYHPIFGAEIASDWLDKEPIIEVSLGGHDPFNNDCFKRDPDYRDRKCMVKADNTYSDLCLYHSRSYSALCEKEPSLLCWPDKLSILYDPSWFYILRATLSGEIKEYRKSAADFDAIPLDMSNMKWITWAKERMIRKAFAKDIRPSYEKGS